MSAPAFTAAVDSVGNIVLTDATGGSTSTTPLSLTLPRPHRWAGTDEQAAVMRDMIAQALVWAQGRHVDQGTLSGGSKSAVALPTTQHIKNTFYSGVAGNL